MTCTTRVTSRAMRAVLPATSPEAPNLQERAFARLNSWRGQSQLEVWAVVDPHHPEGAVIGRITFKRSPLTLRAVVAIVDGAHVRLYETTAPAGVRDPHTWAMEGLTFEGSALQQSSVRVHYHRAQVGRCPTWRSQLADAGFIVARVF